MIETFQRKGFYVFVWNYRGYGCSTGIPTMENIISDGKNLMRLLRSGFGASKVIVYGRSLGGHVAKSLVNESDLIIADRSFSSISLVPRIIMGPRWVQYAYDLMIDNYQMNIRKIMESSTPKILMVDPCVVSNKKERQNHYLSKLCCSWYNRPGLHRLVIRKTSGYRNIKALKATL